MRIIFFGSDDFAAVHLNALVKSAHDVVAVVTPPDKAHGRGMKLSAGAVKEMALHHGIEVLQPANVNEENTIQQLSGYKAELFVVIAYGKILSQKVLDTPKRMAINLHSSLLPQYRGAAPINWAVINGETHTGMSIIKMNQKMDAGAILAQEVIAISENDTAQSLREEMMKAGPDFLMKTINQIEKGNIKPVKQDEKAVTLASKLTKEMGRIDWAQDARSILNLIRGLLPWPGAFTQFDGKMLKILSAKVVELNESAKPGELIELTKKNFTIAAGQDALLIEKVHLQDSKQMDTGSFLRGQNLEKGYQFG